MGTATQYVNIWDPTGALPVGEIVSGRDAIVVSKSRSVVLLPTDPMMYYSASPGFVYRPWGSGWHFDAVKAERGAPVMVAVSERHPWIYWAVLLMPIRAGEELHGDLRLIGNGAAGALSAGIAQDVRLLPLHEYRVGPTGGVIAMGRCSLCVTSPGMLGLSLHGVARNIRVVWSAVSISDQRVDVQAPVPV